MKCYVCVCGKAKPHETFNVKTHLGKLKSIRELSLHFPGVPISELKIWNFFAPYFQSKWIQKTALYYVSLPFWLYIDIWKNFLKSSICSLLSVLYIYTYLDVALAFECTKGNSRHETQVDSIVHVMPGWNCIDFVHNESAFLHFRAENWQSLHFPVWYTYEIEENATKRIASVNKQSRWT